MLETSATVPITSGFAIRTVIHRSHISEVNRRQTLHDDDLVTLLPRTKLHGHLGVPSNLRLDIPARILQVDHNGGPST